MAKAATKLNAQDRVILFCAATRHRRCCGRHSCACNAWLTISPLCPVKWLRPAEASLTEFQNDYQ
jgi:hypothetical protein